MRHAATEYDLRLSHGGGRVNSYCDVSGFRDVEAIYRELSSGVVGTLSDVAVKAFDDHSTTTAVRIGDALEE